MEQQYSADPRLMRWIYNNTCNYPPDLRRLKKIKRLDGKRFHLEPETKATFFFAADTAYSL